MLAVSSLVPSAKPKQHLRPALDDAPSGEHRFPRLPQVQPLGNAVDEQVKHLDARSDHGPQTPDNPPTAAH